MARAAETRPEIHTVQHRRIAASPGTGWSARGTTGAALGSATGQLKATAVAGNGDANGVVRVVNSGGP